MKQRKKYLNIGMFLCLCAAFTGCARVTATTPGQPPRAATPFEQALALNSSLASSNRDIASAVINAATANTIDTPTANSILIVQSRVADWDRQLTAVLQACSTADGKTVTCDGAQVSSLVTQLRNSIDGLVASGSAGIKDPQTRTAITNAVNLVSTLAGQLWVSLEGLGVVK